MVSAFEANRHFKESNTEVYQFLGATWVSLFGNIIAKKDIKTGAVEFSLAGWDTVTTRSRLNALGCNVSRVKGVTVRNGKAWKGDF